MRQLIPFATMLMLALPVAAAPPAGPVQVPPPIAGPTSYCVAWFPVTVPEGASLHPGLVAEYWQPQTVVVRLPEGSFALSVDHSDVDKPRRSDRQRKLTTYRTGKLYSYRPEANSTFRMVFFPKSKYDHRVTIALLPAAPASSRALEYGASTNEISPANYQTVLDLIGLQTRCPIA